MKLLRAEYNRRAQLRPLLWDKTIELPLENVYTRLKIVSRPKAGVQAEGGEVNMYDIFEAPTKGEDVMTLVEGSPGIGKTTFCLKLAYDWANRNTDTAFTFPNFEFVLLLKCRDIDGDIIEAIIEQLLPKDIEKNTREKLLDFLRDIHNQEKILIILDGLDELSEKSKHFVDELLHRRILPFCYVLATCRQERGIDVRKEFVFDILLQIEGFTEGDAFEYIRKHFKNVGPEHSLKGERLIEEIKENTLLHALRSNPLNLLLLCVIYQDYEGKLPSSRTELYQIIVRCLLRRYCAKHKIKAHEDDGDLNKQFKKELLALGKLAWKCLLNDCHSFREDELKELERRNDKLVARELGLLYKEESLKKLNPQHEYCFLHKTFQEHLAALYIAHKLRRNKFNVFEHLDFKDLVQKYPQVFLFVCGLLGEEARILFTQIGVELKDKWDWCNCTEAAATFFIEGFSESGNGEQMAGTLCSFIPFPLHIEVNTFLPGIEHYRHFVKVLKACQRFLNLQQRLKVTVLNGHCFSPNKRNWPILVGDLVSFSQVTSLSLFSFQMTTDEADGLFKVLSEGTGLPEFILTVSDDMTDDVAAIIGKGLAASKSLTKVSIGLFEKRGNTWASTLESGLSADKPSPSVALTIYGSVSETAIEALGKLVTNKSLTSLSLIIFGDMQDLLAAAVGKGLARQTYLNSLDLQVNGKLSSYGASVFERGCIQNRSLNNLRVSVYGEVPVNWPTVLQNLRLSKKAQFSFDFHPDTGSKVAANHLVDFRPVGSENKSVPKQHLTVNLWGELSCDGAEGLCGVLAQCSLYSVTFNVHVELTDAVVDCIARCFLPLQVTFNIWGELSIKEKTVLQRISDNNPTVLLKVHDLCEVPDESCSGRPCSISDSSPVKGTGEDDFSLESDDSVVKHVVWTDVTWLTSLHVTLNNFTTKFGFYSISTKKTSIPSLSVTINNHCSEYQENALTDLCRCLRNNTSLRALTLTINNFEGPWLGKDHRYKYLLSSSLAKNKALTSLTLKVNRYSASGDEWLLSLVDCLAHSTSITELNLTVNVYSEISEDWLPKLCSILTRGDSLTTLRLQVSDHCASGGRIYDFSKLMLECKSLSTLDLTVSFYGSSSG